MLIGGALFGTRSTSAPTRSRSTPAWSPSCRSGGGARAAAGDPQPAGQPGHGRVPAPVWSAVVAVLFGSTAFDSFRDSAWVRFIQSTELSVTRAQQPRPARVLRRGRACSRRRHPCDRHRHDPRARLDLPNQFAHSVVPIIVGLHRRALPDLPRRGRPADADPGQRPVQQRQQPARHGGLERQLLVLLPPDAARLLKVLAVVLGHVVGVVAAHDRAVGCSPGGTSSPASCRCCWRWWRSPSAASTCCSPPDPARPGARPDRRVDRARGRGRRRRPATRPAQASPASARVRPATRARSAVARSSGRKCTPAQPGEAGDHARDVALDQPSVGRIRLTTTGRRARRSGRAARPGRGPAGTARPGRRCRPRPPRRPPPSASRVSRCAGAGPEVGGRVLLEAESGVDDDVARARGPRSSRCSTAPARTSTQRSARGSPVTTLSRSPEAALHGGEPLVELPRSRAGRPRAGPRPRRGPRAAGRRRRRRGRRRRARSEPAPGQLGGEAVASVVRPGAPPGPPDRDHPAGPVAGAVRRARSGGSSAAAGVLLDGGDRGRAARRGRPRRPGRRCRSGGRAAGLRASSRAARPPPGAPGAGAGGRAATSRPGASSPRTATSACPVAVASRSSTSTQRLSTTTPGWR